MCAAAIKDFTRPVADSAGVKRAHAFVHVVANAVLVEVLGASTSTHTEGVKLVVAAVAIASRDVRTSTLVNLAGAVADAARVQCPYAFVHIVADAVLIEVLGASSSTHAQGVELVAVAVASASGQLSTAALKNGARSGTNAALVQVTNTTVAHPISVQILGTTDRQEALFQSHGGHVLVESIGQHGS